MRRVAREGSTERVRVAAINRRGLGSLRYRLAVENWLRLLVSTPICSDLLLGRKAKRLTSANNLASNSVFNQAILRVLLLRCGAPAEKAKEAEGFLRVSRAPAG